MNDIYGEMLAFLLFTSFVIGCTCVNYDFVMETIELTRPVSIWRNDQERVAAHPFNKLSPEQQSDLCFQARARALVDERSSTLGGMEMGVDMFGIELSDGSRSNRIALLCPSIPLIYLRLQDLSLVHEVTIMEKRNPYLDDQQTYNFLPTMVKSITRVDGFDKEISDSVQRALSIGASSLESLGNLPHLVYRNNMERRDMCIAVRRRAWTMAARIISDEWTNVAEKYEVTPAVSEEKKSIVVAFPCNSIPRIYVCVDGSSTRIIHGLVTPDSLT